MLARWNEASAYTFGWPWVCAKDKDRALQASRHPASCPAEQSPAVFCTNANAACEKQLDTHMALIRLGDGTTARGKCKFYEI